MFPYGLLHITSKTIFSSGLHIHELHRCCYHIGHAPTHFELQADSIVPCMQITKFLWAIWYRYRLISLINTINKRKQPDYRVYFINHRQGNINYTCFMIIYSYCMSIWNKIIQYSLCHLFLNRYMSIYWNNIVHTQYKDTRERISDKIQEEKLRRYSSWMNTSKK